MRIIFGISSLGPGGAERVASTLCNAWASQGHEVLLIPTFSGGGKPFYPINSNVTLKYLASELKAAGSGKNYLQRLRTLRHLVKQYHPDFVVSFLPNVNIAAIAATAFTGIPCIIGERSDPSMQPIGRFWSVACKALYRFADAVTVQTDSVGSRIGLIYPGLKRIFALPNPLPHDLVKMAPRNPNASSKDGRRILLSVGRLSKEKRTANIIDSFVRVAHIHPEWDLHLVGDGPLRNELEQQAQKSGLPDGRIRLMGRQQDPWNLMLNADAFVMASEYEGFPNALLEAVALGLPSVSTDCRSGPREISEDGNVALLVPPGNDEKLSQALDKIMGNEALRSRLSSEGAESVRRRYDLQSVLGLWDHVFASVRREDSQP